MRMERERGFPSPPPSLSLFQIDLQSPASVDERGTVEMTSRNSISSYQNVLVILLLLLMPFPLRAQDYLLKVVYIVPADREPHSDYDLRLDYLVKKIQQFFSDHLKAGGYVDGSGAGKTFQYESDGTGNLVVHLIDQSPDGNDPQSNRTVARYVSGEINPWEDIARQLPSEFFTNSAVVILVDQSSISDEHYLRDAPQGGAGESGPGKNGYVIGTDHFFGNDLPYSMENPPLLFDAIGRNDTEQLAIFKDTRFTNTRMGYLGWRPAPSLWNPGEDPSVENLRVWEYASITIGALIHEIGHAFALPHTFRYTEGNTPGIHGDFNVMGNGFRRIYRSLFPEESFPQSEQYPRLTTIYDQGFDTGAILHPVQLPRLSRNQFFHSGATEMDFERPSISNLEVQYDANAKVLQVELIMQDAGPSGLSHITCLMDWNAHWVEEVADEEKFDRIAMQTTLGFTPEEYSGNAFSRGIHSLVAEAMDREGNVPPFSESLYYYGIGDGYLQDWMIFSHYFDAYALLPYGASLEDQLTHHYFTMADHVLKPRFGQQAGFGSWRYRRTGAYLSVTDKMPLYFIDPPQWSSRRVCYAATRLVSNRERSLNLLLGYNDYLQVFLNGVQAYVDTDFSSGHDPFDPTYVKTIPVTLQEGENLLLVKHLNDWSWGGFWVCFRESGGEAVEVESYPSANPDALGILIPRQTGVQGWPSYR